MFCDGKKRYIFDKKSYGSLNDFKLDPKCKVYVIQDYATPELFKKMHVMFPKCYHVSDLRTSDPRPYNYDIILNSALEILLHLELKPKLAYLKFVTPSLNDKGLESVKDHPHIIECKKKGYNLIEEYYKGNFVFFDGELLIQPWAPRESSEMRLIPNDQKKIYNILDMRMKFIYQMIFRSFVPTNIKLNKDLLNMGYDKCNDCAIEIDILKNQGIDFEDAKNILDEETGYDLKSKCPKHGNLLEYRGIKFKFDVEYVEYQVNIY